MILELYPQQSLPVKNEDLGKNSLAKEMELMKAEMARLSEDNKSLKARKVRLVQIRDEESFKSNERLEIDKAALQEALRAQTLINEEQRKYIEILKEALEAKINDFEIRDFLVKSVEQGLDPAEQFTQLALMQKSLEEKRLEILRKEEEMEGILSDLQALNNAPSHLDNSKKLKEQAVLIKDLKKKVMVGE
jgi:hypothetical protein